MCDFSDVNLDYSDQIYAHIKILIPPPPPHPNPNPNPPAVLGNQRKDKYSVSDVSGLQFSEQSARKKCRRLHQLWDLKTL